MVANVKKRTTAEIARDLLDARRSGDNAAQNMAAAELAQNTAERREKAKSYQKSKKADAIQKALEDARKREEREKTAAEFRSSIGEPQTEFGIRGKNSFESRFPVLTQRQLDTAAVSHAAKEKQAATKAYDDYQKSGERKANVDDATNEILKKVFGNLGQGNADLQLQSAPRQILESKKQDKEKELEARKDYAVNQENAAKNAQVTHKNMDDLSNWSEEDRKALQLYATNRNRDLNAPIELTSSPWYQTAEQEASGLIAKYGKQRVDALAESFQRSENQTAAENVMAAAQKGADGFWGGVGHSAASVAAKLIGGTTGPLGYLQEAATGTGQYSTLDPNNAGQLPDIYASAVREQVGENIEHSDAMRRFGEALTGAAAYTQTGQLPAMKVHQPEREGESSTAGKVGATLYKAGMGAADTVARGVMGGGSKALSLGLAAGQSFGNTVSQASKQGASPGQAMTLGAVNAGIEAATEYIPLDELLKTAKSGSAGVKAVLTNVLKQAGIEATTEEISLMGTTLAEAAILREKSGYNQQIQNAIANGASYQQAKLEADRALLAEAGETAIVSALSGAMSTAGAEVSARTPQIQQTAQDKLQETAGWIADAMHQAKQNQQGQKVQPEARVSDPQTTKEKLNAAIQEAMGVKKNTAESEETTVNVRSAGTAITEENKAKNTLSYTLAANLGTIQDMEPVSHLSGKEFKKQEGVSLPDQIRNFFKTLGNKVTRSGFGDVSLNEYGVGGMLNHRPLNRAKLVSLAAVPEVISKGRQIDYDPNWKGRGYETYIFAAPVKVSGTDVYVAAVVNKNPDNKFYLSEMVDSNGNYVRIEESPSGNSKYGATDGAGIPGRADAPLGPEGLPEESIPSATRAEPTSLPKNSIPNRGGIVNENRSGNRPQGVDIEKQSAEGGQEGENGIPEKTSYDEYILRNEDGTPFEAMGAASLGNSGKLEYDSLLYDGNIQRTRKGDVREIEVPIEDADGRNVSEFVGNSMNSAATADVFTDTIKRIVAEGKVSHDVQTNEESLRKAAEELKNEGDTYKSVQNIKAVAESGKCSTEDIAKAVLLYENLMDQIDQKAQNGEDAEQLLQSMAEDTYVSLAQMATNSGRNLQLFSLFRKMTPESQAKILENEVMRAIKKLQKQGTVKKGYQAQVDPNLLEDYKKAAEENRRAKDPEAKQAAEQKMKDIQNAIYKAEAAKVPASFKAKWDAWRYMAMLGNVKTQLRNVGGNFAFKPYVEIKELLATGMEKLFIRDKSKRTRAQMHRVFSQDDRELYRWAKADAKSEGMKNVLKGSAKLGDDMSKSNLADDMHIFNNKVFETVRKSVNGAVEAGDMLFKNPYYADALASYVKAKGYSVADIEAGHVSEEVLNEGRKFAVDEAMKNTFNDCNALSDFFANTLRYKGDNPVGKVANTMAEGILPFRRTPANVIVRFAEYSPIGVAKGIGSTINHLRGGEISAATAIDQLASGLTGTAMAGLGYALANGFLGLKLRGSNVDEDEERQGHQEYALEFSIGGKEYSYKIDWAAPGNLPLFLGANIYEWVNGQGGDTSVSKFTSFVYGFLTMFEPMLELSCLSSLNDIIEAGKYSDGNALYAVAAQAAFSYFTQGIPSLIRQTTQAFPENKQQTFANSSDPLIRDMQRRAANIPIVGAAFKMDKVDEWGETESQGKWYERAFHAYFNPGTLKAIDNSNLEQEISRLNQAQPDSVTPPETAKTITFTDSNGNRHTNRRLTEEEYSKLATVQGQTAKQILDQLIDSKSYRSLTDEQKAKAFGYVYDYAREKGRTEAIEGYQGMDGWMEGIEEGKEAKAVLDKILSGSLDDSFKSLTKGWREGTEADVSGDLESAYETYKGMTAAEKTAFKEENSGRIAKYLEAREHGIKTDTYLDLYESYYNLDQRKDIDTTEKAHQWAETVQKAREAGKINDGQKDYLRSNLDFRYSMEAETEKFDEMVDSGISSQKAFDVGSLLRGIEPVEGKEDVSNSQKWEAIADMDFLSEAEKDSVMKVHMPDYDPADESPNTTELKYDYIRQELGYSAEEFVDIYMAYLENNKKDDRIDAWMDLGYSRAEANVLYQLYGASGKNKIDVVAWHNAR